MKDYSEIFQVRHQDCMMYRAPFRMCVTNSRFVNMAKAKSKRLPYYKNPPVGEVACGIRFEPLRDFKAPHAGLFWEKIRGRFPTCEHAPPIGIKLESFDPASLPLPRIWFISEQGNNLIQLQNDRFHFNWRRRSDEEQYPRYEFVIQAFKEHFTIFKTFLHETGLGPLNPLDCELLYNNYIPKEKAWESVTDIGKILPDLSWRITSDRFLPDPHQIVWQVGCTLPQDRGSLNISLQQGSRKADKVPIFILGLVAQGLGDDKSESAIWDWFDLAHDSIVRGFADLTSVEAQRELWQRVDNP